MTLTRNFLFWLILGVHVNRDVNQKFTYEYLIFSSLLQYFYTDEHLPIHVHLENSDGLAKIELEPEIRLVENKGIKSKDIKRAMSIVEQYKEEFIEKWKEFHGE